MRRIAPGARVNLRDLTRAFHVSNTPVRDALARLADEGLVLREHNRGYFASPLLDTRTVCELYDLRLMIEPSMAGRAARRKDLDLHALESAVDCDLEFHIAIAKVSGNRLMASLLTDVFLDLRAYAGCRVGGVDESRVEHDEIVRAIRENDAEGAAAALRGHLSRTMERVRAQFS